MMKVTNVKELFDSDADDTETMINNAVSLLKSSSANRERFMSMVISLDDADNIEIQQIDTVSPIFSGMIGLILFKSFVDYYVSIGKSEVEAMRDIAFLFNTSDVKICKQ